MRYYNLCLAVFKIVHILSLQDGIIIRLKIIILRNHN